MQVRVEPDGSTVLDAPVVPAAEPEDKPEAFDWRAVAAHPAAQAAGIVLVGIALVFWKFLAALPGFWLGDDGYFSHGFLVPFIVGFIVYKSWPYISTREVKPSLIGLIVLVPILWVGAASNSIGFNTGTSIVVVGALWASVWFVAGWEWLKGLALPCLYFVFGFPMWSWLIDKYTLPLQVLSTDSAFALLKAIGLNPTRGSGSDTTTIYLSNFTLDVGIPCSGLKLLLALSAFTAFFMLIARIKWWANAILVASVLPLCLIVNGLRIAMIGWVGNMWGSDAGKHFHDYSGYIALVVCFIILGKFVRLLGWKD